MNLFKFKFFFKLSEFQKAFQEDKRNFEFNLDNGIKEIINLETKMTSKIEQETLVNIYILFKFKKLLK